jgi:hypothetical protein
MGVLSRLAQPEGIFPAKPDLPRLQSKTERFVVDRAKLIDVWVIIPNRIEPALIVMRLACEVREATKRAIVVVGNRIYALEHVISPRKRYTVGGAAARSQRSRRSIWVRGRWSEQLLSLLRCNPS